TFDNQGSVRKFAGTGTTTLGLTFTNGGTLDVQTGTINLDTGLTNFAPASNTLTGGAYLLRGALRFTGANVVTNKATIVLDGTASALLNASGANGLANLASNAAATSTLPGGSITVQNGRLLSTTAAFSNAGSVTVGAGSTFSTSA